MAIIFRLKSSTSEESHRVQSRLHDALIGSPAYVNSEIAICDGEKDNPDSSFFYLAVGLESVKGPRFDSHIDVDSDSFYYTDAEDAKRRNGSDTVQGEAPIQIYFSAFTDNNVKEDADAEIDKVFCNLSNEYPEFHFTSSASIRKFPAYNNPEDEDAEPDCYNVVMSVTGTVPVDKVDEFIKLNHHGEALYSGTKLENVHIEVLVNGEWH